MPHLAEYRRTHFFSVCDGHGVYGKEVSEFVKSTLGGKVEREIKRIFDKAKQSQRVVDSNEVKEALTVSFRHTTAALNNSGIDLYFSGSTCVTVLVVGNKVFCANVGDSRAVLAREENGVYVGYPLNRDHKASEPDEE
jgi:serine/threonine protein phosphatase PrpC